jgi:MbtH protein
MNQVKQSEVMYYVVVNHENQHSVWPAHKDIPFGWRADGDAQSKEACLDYIAQHWTDITPLSARSVSMH